MEDIRRDLGYAATLCHLEIVFGGAELRYPGETESNTTTRHRGASRLALNFKVQEPDSTVETVGNNTVSSV